MRNNKRFSIFGCSSAIGVVAMCIAGTPAAAAQPTHSFNISAGELAQALNGFAQQGGQEILFSSSIVAGKRTNGVKGNLPPREALRALLQGTGLTMRGDSVLTLGAVDKPQAAPMPPTLSYLSQPAPAGAAAQEAPSSPPPAARRP